MALCGGDGKFRDIYNLVQAYERWLWGEVSYHAGRLGVAEKELPRIYRESLHRVRAIDDS